MDKPFEKQTRIFVLPVCTVLSDQKAPIRAAGIQTLTAIATACKGLDALVHELTVALEVNQPLQRAQLLGWAVDWLKEHEMTPGLDLNFCPFSLGPSGSIKGNVLRRFPRRVLHRNSVAQGRNDLV
jgi:hypothetical protein